MPPATQIRSKICCLHRPRTAAGEYRAASEGEARSELGCCAVHIVSAREVMTAHDPDDVARLKV